MWWIANNYKDSRLFLSSMEVNAKPSTPSNTSQTKQYLIISIIPYYLDKTSAIIYNNVDIIY